MILRNSVAEIEETIQALPSLTRKGHSLKTFASLHSVSSSDSRIATHLESTPFSTPLIYSKHAAMGRLTTSLAASVTHADNIPGVLPNISLLDVLLPRSLASSGNKRNVSLQLYFDRTSHWQTSHSIGAKASPTSVVAPVFSCQILEGKTHLSPFTHSNNGPLRAKRLSRTEPSCH